MNSKCSTPVVLGSHVTLATFHLAHHMIRKLTNARRTQILWNSGEHLRGVMLLSLDLVNIIDNNEENYCSVLNTWDFSLWLGNVVVIRRIGNGLQIVNLAFGPFIIIWTLEGVMLFPWTSRSHSSANINSTRPKTLQNNVSRNGTIKTIDKCMVQTIFRDRKCLSHERFTASKCVWRNCRKYRGIFVHIPRLSSRIVIGAFDNASVVTKTFVSAWLQVARW